MKRSDTADLPFHGERVPPWIANRMKELGTAIAEQVILNYGQSEFLTRLSDPFWFQAYGVVMGVDWYSSGIMWSSRRLLSHCSSRWSLRHMRRQEQSRLTSCGRCEANA